MTEFSILKKLVTWARGLSLKLNARPFPLAPLLFLLSLRCSLLACLHPAVVPVHGVALLSGDDEVGQDGAGVSRISKVFISQQAIEKRFELPPRCRVSFGVVTAETALLARSMALRISVSSMMNIYLYLASRL